MLHGSSSRGGVGFALEVGDTPLANWRAKLIARFPYCRSPNEVAALLPAFPCVEWADWRQSILPFLMPSFSNSVAAFSVLVFATISHAQTTCEARHDAFYDDISGRKINLGQTDGPHRAGRMTGSRGGRGWTLTCAGSISCRRM